MALQASGAISWSQIQSEFGGSNPIAISEYYRGGLFVPNSLDLSDPGGLANYTESGLTYSYNQSTYYISFYYAEEQDPSAPWFGRLVWNGSQLFTASGTGDYTSLPTSVNFGDGFTYYRSPTYLDRDVETLFPETVRSTYWYAIRRVGPVLVNQSIPTSGTISSSNFYLGRKT